MGRLRGAHWGRFGAVMNDSRMKKVFVDVSADVIVDFYL